jgi:hypothetical protein
LAGALWVEWWERKLHLQGLEGHKRDKVETVILATALRTFILKGSLVY